MIKKREIKEIIPFYAQVILRKETKRGEETYYLVSEKAHVSNEENHNNVHYSDISFKLQITRERYELLIKKMGKRVFGLNENLELKVL